jgi:hypothetical protein
MIAVEPIDCRWSVDGVDMPAFHFFADSFRAERVDCADEEAGAARQVSA